MQPDDLKPTDLDPRLRRRRAAPRRFGIVAVAVAATLLLTSHLGVSTVGSADPTTAGVPARSGASVPRVAPRPPATRISTTPATGVQYHGTWSIYTDAERERILTQLAAAGVTWVRIDISWATLQPDRDGYDTKWAVPFYDRVFAQARAKGLKVLGTFWQAPHWANDSANVNTPPRDPAQFAAAAAWAAHRWASSVDAWEIWNEPNSGDFFTGSDPAAYTRVLCATYPAVKKADPNSPVLFGGLMYNDDAWLRRAYAAGAHGCFDVMATHPYEGPSNAPPQTADDGNAWHLTHVPAVHQVMVANGDGDKPIWFTEFGWSSGQPANPEPWDTGVSEQTQAAYLTQAVNLTASRYPYVKAVFWFRAADHSTADAHEDHYGLLRTDLTPKPALAAMGALNGR